VLLDLGAILGTQLLVWWTVSADRSAMYPTAYVLYLLGLAARSFDRSYLNGLRRYLDDRSEHVAFYMLAAVALSLPGVTGLAPWFGFWGGFAAALLANLGLHAWLKQRARAEPPRSSHRALDLALAATLVPICALHEVTIYDILVDTAGDLGPFALSFVPVFVLLGYWPLRLHAFVDEPEDRSSVLWFWLTVGWLTAQPLIVFGGQIARMR
jgi:hypothetical protein